MNIKKYFLCVSLNEKFANSDSISHTYIQWNKEDMSLVKAKVHKTDNMTVCSMTNYNDSIWNPKEHEAENYVFTIVKE